jgi:KDO2-lipid IV(A) lauroyltransferase
MKPRIVRLLFRALGALPFRVMEAAGAFIGLLHWHLPNRTREHARANIERCFAGRDPRWRRDLLRANLVSTGRTLAETAWLLRRPPGDALALVDEVRGGEHFEQARAEGGGVILATPHLGCWELAGAFVAQQAPLTALYRPPRLASMDAVLRGGRERLGSRMVPTDGSGVRALHRALRAGECIGLLPDQQPRDGQGVEAPFMGQPALTMTLLSRIAARTGAPVIFVAMVRNPRGRGFTAHLWRADAALTDADPAVAAAAVNREVERAIMLAPEQYMWNYQRFRRRRQGAGKGAAAASPAG